MGVGRSLLGAVVKKVEVGVVLGKVAVGVGSSVVHGAGAGLAADPEDGGFAKGEVVSFLVAVPVVCRWGCCECVRHALVASEFFTASFTESLHLGWTFPKVIKDRTMPKKRATVGLFGDARPVASWSVTEAVALSTERMGATER